MLTRRMLLQAALGRELFDGRSADGWTSVTGGPFPAHCWRIEDGCLRALNVAPAGFEDIRTVAEYGDFDLTFQWKIEAGGNSGVKYLLQKVDRWENRKGPGIHARARGCEYQLGQDARWGAGDLYGRVGASERRERPAGEWNDGRIVVRRPQIEHWLNGRKVVETVLSGELPARSPVALQNHASNVWFRGFRIREL